MLPNKVTEINNSEVYKDIQSYLSEIELESSVTRKHYEDHLRQFFLQTRNKDIEFLIKKDMSYTNNEMKDYKSWLKKEKKYANSSVNAKLSAVSSLFRELEKISVVENGERKRKYDISSNEMKVKQLSRSDSKSHGDVEWQEVDEMIQIVKGMPSKAKPHSKAVLLHIARMTGIRLDDIVNLTYDNIKRINNLWVIDYIGKGNKQNQIPIKDKDYQLLLELKDSPERKQDNDRIFQMSKKTVDRMLTFLKDEMNIDDNRNITFHSFRRCCAKEAYIASGKDIVLVQKLLGHESIETTLIYLKKEEDLEKYPTLYMGEEIDSSLIEGYMDQELFESLDRSTQMNIINKLRDMQK